MNAVRFQERLETLNIPELEHEARYFQICEKLMQEIASVMKQFESNYVNPPLARNIPYFAGRISWARNFYRRLEEPMNAICTKVPRLLVTKVGQELVSAYNLASAKIVGYEISAYSTWTKLVVSCVYK